MSAAPAVISQKNAEVVAGFWQKAPSACTAEKLSPQSRLMGQDLSSRDEDDNRVRKPYTITKQRERWTENEHRKFLEALKLHGRAWRRVEEHVSTKTAVQIRSHAQKFFSKVAREASNGVLSTTIQGIDIPPPRPKRRPARPYPRKAGASPDLLEAENGSSSGVSSAVPSPVGPHHSLLTSPSNCQVLSFPLNDGCREGTQASHGSVAESFINQCELHESLKLCGKGDVLLSTSDEHVVETLPEGCGIKDDMLSTTKPGDRNCEEGFSSCMKVVLPSNDNNKNRRSSNLNVFRQGSVVDAVNRTQQWHSDLPHVPTKDGLHTQTNIGMVNPDCKGVNDSTRERIMQAMPILPEKAPQDTESGASPTDPHSCPAYLLLDSFCSNRAQVPTMPPLDLISSASLSPFCNMLQALAMNQSAAYTAAMAAARWAMVAGAQSVGSNPNLCSNIHQDGKVMPPPTPFSDHQLNAAAFAAASTSWWAFGGLLPPVIPFYPPSGAIMSSYLYDAPISQSFFENVKDGLMIPKATAHGCERGQMRDTPLIQTWPMSASIQHQVTVPKEATNAHVREQTLDSAAENDEVSSSEDFSRPDNEDANVDCDPAAKSGSNGSSSGSNMPNYGCDSSEPETPNTSGSDMMNNDVKRDSKGDDSVRSKKKKQNHIKSSHSENDIANKRLKSTRHDLDVRREVSQEGRKAFQALFVGKALPQTFPMEAGVTDVKPLDPEKCRSVPTMLTMVVPGSAHKEITNSGGKGIFLPPQNDELCAKAPVICSRPKKSGFVPYQRIHAGCGVLGATKQ